MINRIPKPKRTAYFAASICLASFTIIILGTCIPGCGSSTSSTFALFKAQKGTFKVVIPAFGELQAVRSTTIFVPQELRSQQYVAWLAPENSKVKGGDVIARLDSMSYLDRIKAEKFTISKMDLEILQKEKEMEKEKNELLGQLEMTRIEKNMSELYGARDETIYSRNQIIDATLDLEYLKKKTEYFEKKKKQLEDKARTELQLLRLKRQMSQMKVDQYNSMLDKLEIKAPHDGVLIYSKNWRGEKPQVGNSVYPGYPLGKLPDLSLMEVKAWVLESEAAGLKDKLPVSVRLDASPREIYPGTVNTIDTIAKPLEEESTLKYFEIKASLKKTEPKKMKPGNQVHIWILAQEKKDVIAIPNQAIIFEKGKPYVFIKKGSSIQKKQVETGDRSLTQTVITKGLAEGEMVVLGDVKSQDQE